MTEIHETAGELEFLLSEQNAMLEEIRRLRSEGLNRLNFFITITSAVVGGLVVLSQLASIPTGFLQHISILALLFLVLIGWGTFEFAISRDIATDSDVRATGRIRRYFIDRNPLLLQYLTWQLHDEPTSWVRDNHSEIRRSAQSILSLVIALITGLIASFLAGDLLLLAVTGIISFIVAYALLGIYARRRYDAACLQANQTSRFPRIKPPSVDKNQESERVVL